MSDKYGRGESGDILEDLNSLKIDRQKDAVKKVISAMTIGRDVGKLFPQVVKCIATNDLELKKLVYLYIINYARIKPVETLLAVNSFKKDASDLNNNPLTRALAVRTMGCLGVEQIMQFLCDPLKDALMDKDPYVRKTGALCVAKIYDINSQLVEEQFCFVDLLLRMIEEEGNAMVIANCLAALVEISTTKGEDIIKMNWRKTRHLMNALHENNEWCQIYLLEGISGYSPQTQDEILEVIDRVLPFVSHSNSGVILSAIKILIKTLDLVESAETVRSVCKKITPSLVTLLSSEPEIQFVALKNINILIQKRPIIFEKDIKMFFCNFTEPIYNKMEKLEILYKLVTMNNVDLVLNELKEYSGEVDVQFVKRSVRLVGQLAIKLEKAAQRCVELLVELVKTQISFVIQEAIISLRDVFRRYPNTFEGAMAIVNENLKTLNDSEAKAALIWIIGEYADRIDGAETQLLRFLDTYIFFI
jgi:AP-1 complex subunit beta-1